MMISAIKMGFVFGLFCALVFIVFPYLGGDFVDHLDVSSLIIFLCLIPLFIGFIGARGLLQPADKHFGFTGAIRWAIFGIIIGSLGELSIFLHNTNKASFLLSFFLFVIGGVIYWLLFKDIQGP